MDPFNPAIKAQLELATQGVLSDLLQGEPALGCAIACRPFIHRTSRRPASHGSMLPGWRVPHIRELQEAQAKSGALQSSQDGARQSLLRMSASQECQDIDVRCCSTKARLSLSQHSIPVVCPLLGVQTQATIGCSSCRSKQGTELKVWPMYQCAREFHVHRCICRQGSGDQGFACPGSNPAHHQPRTLHTPAQAADQPAAAHQTAHPIPGRHSSHSLPSTHLVAGCGLESCLRDGEQGNQFTWQNLICLHNQRCP